MASSETSIHSRLDLQNREDTPGGGRRSLLRRSSQSSVCKKRREGERENDWFCFNNFYTPFLYSCMPYAYFAIVKHKALCGRLISPLTWFDWFHKYWRFPATKVFVLGPIFSVVRNLTRRANLAPPWVGEKYSLTLTPQFSYLWYKGTENLPNETSVIRLTHRPFLI